MNAYISTSYLTECFETLCFDARRAKKELECFVAELVDAKVISKHRHGYIVVDSDFNAVLSAVAQKERSR